MPAGQVAVSFVIVAVTPMDAGLSDLYRRRLAVGMGSVPILGDRFRPFGSVAMTSWK